MEGIEPGELRQGLGNGTHKVVVTQVQLSYKDVRWSVTIALDTVPIALRSYGTKPTHTMLPSTPVGRLEQRDEGRALFRRNRDLTRWS